MFIETETTPYPAKLKFLPGCPVMEKGTADFADANDARRSPLATALFDVEGITRALVREQTSGGGLPTCGLRISGSERRPAYRALSSG
jgi:hypothetical protein